MGGFFDSETCNPGRPLQESPRPGGPGIPKGPSDPGPKQCPKQSRNSLRSLETVYLRLRRLFRHFLNAGAGRPRDSLETLSGFRARRARETPVRGGQGCNPKPSFPDFGDFGPCTILAEIITKYFLGTHRFHQKIFFVMLLPKNGVSLFARKEDKEFAF